MRFCWALLTFLALTRPVWAAQERVDLARSCNGPTGHT